jgi:polysaccharide export outer membrane protein
MRRDHAPEDERLVMVACRGGHASRFPAILLAMIRRSLRRMSPTVALLLAMLCTWAGEAVPVAPTPTVAPVGLVPVTGPVPRDYTLYPGDLLKIEVFDHADLTTTLRVPANGMVGFPLIGEIKGLVGRSIDQLAGEISRRLLDGYIRQAVVTATVTEFSPRYAYVMGNVAKPSNIPLSPFGQLTAMQAIGQAGGFLEDANRAGAQVIRDDPATPGAKLGLPLPVSDRADSLTGDIELKPNDIIIVPRLDRVYIIGQVGKPGAVNLPSQEVLTVSKAVSLAGGFAQYAKQSDVQLMRAGKRVQVVDVRAILTGDNKIPDPVLQPGDTVYVPESRF